MIGHATFDFEDLVAYYGSLDDPVAMSSSMAGLIKDLHNSHEGFLINGAEKAAKTKPTVKVTTELREADPPAQICSCCSRGKF
jgi:hypothetical protein